MKGKLLLSMLAASLLVVGCQTVPSGYDVQGGTNQLTVGRVQREIKIGMSGAEVLSVLGSPNIVSTDEERRETWAYDKIATDRAYSSSSGGVNVLIIGGASSSGVTTTSQRTLTIIIKFDKDGNVRDFAYHTSRF